LRASAEANAKGRVHDLRASAEANAKDRGAINVLLLGLRSWVSGESGTRTDWDRGAVDPIRALLLDYDSAISK
jgi:hypothetical protein